MCHNIDLRQNGYLVIEGRGGGTVGEEIQEVAARSSVHNMLVDDGEAGIVCVGAGVKVVPAFRQVVGVRLVVCVTRVRVKVLGERQRGDARTPRVLHLHIVNGQNFSTRSKLFYDIRN